MLLVSLGVVSLGLTSCGETSSEPSSEPSTPSVESSTPTEETSPSVESSTPEETPSVESSTPEETPTGPSDSVEPILPEETAFDVTFNYNDPENSLTVWTGTPVNGTIAPHPENISENPDIVDLYSTPIPRGDECDTANGYYYFAIDANGYLVYASYGLGDGYGSPCDGYYHNQETKDIFEAEYWSLHLEYDFWPAVTSDGRNAWTLFDFIIPEDGFVVKGHADEPVFKSFWKELTGQGSAPKQTNSYLENNVAPGTFNNLYFSINEDRQLSMRERTDAEIAVDGEQEEETPAIRFEYDEEIDAVPTFTSVADVNALDLSAGATVENVKGVITNIRGGNVIIEDESGNAILIYDNTLQENYVVGDTIVVAGEAVLYNGHPELKNLTSVVKVEGYGEVKLDSAIEVTEDNVAEVWTLDNNYQVMKLVKAQVVSIDSKGSSKLQLGETEVVLYKATFPETVQVGDYIDVTCTMEAYKETAQGRPISAENAIVKYYGVNVDVDGVDGEKESVTYLAALGEQVTMVASHDDKAYQFKHWEKLVVGEDGTETWENVSESSSYTVTITETTDTYRAVFGFGPWENLGGDMELALQQAPKSVNSDAGGDAFAVITDPTAKFHTDGNWNNGLFNTSWRYIIAVDKDGKVAYAVNCPANGYGGPSGSGYYRHSDYADYMTNPAFNILEGYGPWTPEDASASGKFEIVVPEGGFIITSHGAANDPLIAALTNDKVTSTEDAGLTNSVDGGSDATRIYYDEANNEIRIYNSAATEADIIIADNSDVVRHAAGTELYNGTDWANGVWANYMIVDSEGVIAYNAWNIGNGYGGPGGFYANPKYAENNPCVVIAEDGTYKIVVPEGFTGLKFGYGDYLNSLYSALSWGQITHSILDANAWGSDAKAWNSLANPFIAADARVEIRNGMLIINGGTEPVREPAPALNEVVPGAISVWDGTVAPTTSDYTIGVDATGKVIYASYGLGGGYGGPADGFYHDGTYAVVPGELCGIFDLDPEFAGWPNVTEDGRNAWGLYTLTVPEGGYILSGNADAMDDLVLALTGLNLADYTANGLFENELEDGILNTKVVKVDTTGEEIAITVGDYVPPVEEVNVTIDASAATVFTGAEGENVALGDWTVAYNAEGRVIFASKTAPGYGGPADGFYHDGEYSVVAGQTCGIFNLDAEFAGWPNKTGDDRDAWTLYTVVVPEGVTIVTGDEATMMPILKAIFGVEEVTQAWLEGTIKDGDYNHVKVSK